MWIPVRPAVCLGEFLAVFLRFSLQQFVQAGDFLLVAGGLSANLLFQGLEITTGGQRLHLREDLEAALRSRSIEPANFESHLAMFDLGMPPHGGFAIGLERLTCQVLNLPNVRQAVLYPRDRYKLTP